MAGELGMTGSHKVAALKPQNTLALKLTEKSAVRSHPWYGARSQAHADCSELWIDVDATLDAHLQLLAAMLMYSLIYTSVALTPVPTLEQSSALTRDTQIF